MTNSRFALPMLVWCGWALFTLFLHAGPQSISTRLQAMFLDLSGTAAGVLQSGRSMAGAAWPQISENGENAELERLTAENLALKRHAARLQKALDAQSKIPQLPPRADEFGLLRTTEVAARILGMRTADHGSESELLLSLGRRHGLVGSELVLNGSGALVDRGSEDGLAPDQLVADGRSLFGRTVDVGAWTTLVQPVTDAEFRIAARIVRLTAQGPVEGPQGILKGTGTGCRLDEIPATEAVAPGDLVYTAVLASPSGQSFYCGKVTQADADPAASHWTIEIASACAPQDLPRHVSVLRTELNPRRIARPNENASVR